MRYLTLAAALCSLRLAQAQCNGDSCAIQCLIEKSVPHKDPTHAEYAQLIIPFNTRLSYEPAVVVLPTTEQHVQDAVSCAAQTGLKVQARSGGHGYASHSIGGKDGSMNINLQGFQKIQLDEDTGVAEVGGGVRLGNLAGGLWEDRRVLSHVSAYVPIDTSPY
jgi:FAD/FMN-containing dehydrogenase